MVVNLAASWADCTEPERMFCACLAVRFRPLNQVRNRRADPDADARLRALDKLMTESPALLAREQVYARYTDALAAFVAKETHADPSGIAPWVAANAMLGLHRALVTHVRQQVLAGEHDRARLARELRAQARQAAALLERGLGQFGG